MTAPADPTVTAAELCEWLGLAERSVRDLARRGVIAREGRNRYRLRASVRAVVEDQRRLLAGQGDASQAALAAAARTRLATLQADMVATKQAALAGRLLDAGAVEAEWSGVLRTVRSGMLAVPSRAAQRLPHLTAHDVATIDGEVRAVLSDVGEDRAPAT